MSEFKREERYIVVKLKHLAGLQIAPLRNFLRENRVPTLDCVVVESDWPEYEKVWQSIERRMTGQPAVTAAEELEAVLHWRGKHTQAIRERDALQQRLTAADERADTVELNLSIESAKLEQARATNKRVVALQDLLTHAHIAIHAMEPGFFLLEKIDAELKQTEASSYACTWQYGAFSWHTACGQEWMLNDGTPEQNGMHFCHSCGKALVVDEGQPESERES